MKTALKVIILFLIVFSWRMPVFYNTTVLSVFISTCYYLSTRKALPYVQFNNRYIFTIFLATLAISFVFLLVIVLHESYDYLIHQKRIYLQMFMMFATVYAFPIFIEGKEKHAFEEMAKIIGITFAVQGAIHLTGFIHKPFGEMIINMCGHHEEYLKADMANIKKYRYMACSGSIFFELPGAYGAASIILFRLLLIKGQRYIYGYGPMIVIFFIIAGICLTGRTGFIGFFMGLAGYLFFVPKNFPGWNKNLKRWGIFVAVCGIIYGGFLSPKQREDFTEDLLPFAFEAYYNWRDHGKFKTGSSDVTMEVHYYPLRSETWLHGHGRSSDTTPGYYHTDAGYMDHLIFGGIFFLLALSLYQILYFIEPLSIANSRGTSESKRDFYFFMILMLHFFTIEYKGSALGIQHYTECLSLAAGLSYIIRHKYRLANELQGNS